MVRWAQAMPRLTIDDIRLNDLGNDMYQIEAVISNAGFLPTYLSQKAQQLKISKPVLVSLDSDKGLICGEQCQNIGDLSSYGLCNTSTRFYGNIVTGNSEAVSKKVSWISRGKRDQITVTAATPKGGKVSRTIFLREC